VSERDKIISDLANRWPILAFALVILMMVFGFSYYVVIIPGNRTEIVIAEMLDQQNVQMQYAEKVIELLERLIIGIDERRSIELDNAHRLTRLEMLSHTHPIDTPW